MHTSEKNPGYAPGGSKGFPLRVVILVKMAIRQKWRIFAKVFTKVEHVEIGDFDEI